jgi:lipopolysaccharide transport system ATP-binding protein
MTSEIAIRVENLGKRYVLGVYSGKSKRSRYRTLRDTLADSAIGAVRWLRRGGQNDRVASPAAEEFWALKDVSFEIRSGEVVGIIGRNGAGKSTLLKILSRITEPTEGRLTIRGRVASLLEVGTGFHPELTGRENIFLNGAILGMHRVEIKAKFDEIVAFAEVEKFLDTPVKRYSSGMYVRLAFAVAAHMEPEILVVDEVLAVGDVEFQKKCLGKMESVSRQEGRTVLFVSHNLAAIKSLCTTGILLRNGQMVMRSDAASVVGEYLAASEARAAIEWEPDRAPRADYIRFTKAYVLNDRDEQILDFDTDEPLILCVEYEVLNATPNLRIGFYMQNSEGVSVCGSNDADYSQGETAAPGVYVSRCKFPGHVLNGGTFLVGFGADTPGYVNASVITDACLFFRVIDQHGHGPMRERTPGLIRPRLHWEGRAI